MIPNPIRKVLSTLRSRNVRFLLMGGQACVFYGGAEFSRDTDIVLFLDPANVARFSEALRELQAESIAVPPFELDYLRRGHAVHFRCRAPDAAGIRLDIMATLRGMDNFARLWERRTTVSTDDGWTIELLSLPDLVRAKKTQRDKDWPMVRRLVEANYTEYRDQASPERIRFWAMESRTPGLLVEVASRFPETIQTLVEQRPLLTSAVKGDLQALETELAEEERREKDQDRAYWKSLVEELESLRHRKTDS